MSKMTRGVQLVLFVSLLLPVSGLQAQALVQDNKANVIRAFSVVSSAVSSLGVTRFLSTMQARTDRLIETTGLMQQQREKAEAAAVGEGGRLGGLVRDTRTEDVVAEGDTTLLGQAGVLAGSVDQLCLRANIQQCGMIRNTVMHYETAVSNLVTKYHIPVASFLKVHPGQAQSAAAQVAQATGIDSAGRSGSQYRALVQQALDASALDSLAQTRSGELDALFNGELKGDVSSGRATMLSLVQHYGTLRLMAASARTEIDKLSTTARGARVEIADHRQRDANVMKAVVR